MKKFIVFAILVIGAGAVFFLANKNIPAPDHHIEKVISNYRFLK